MIQNRYSLDDSTLSSVRQDPEAFTRDLRVAAAVKWYELPRISQMEGNFSGGSRGSI